MRSWQAQHLLKPLWVQHGGRRKLAADTGISEGHLSKVNGGKAPLTLPAAETIARALGVSLLDLGAPAEVAADDPASMTLRDILVQLGAEVAQLSEELVHARDRLDTLESELATRPGSGAPRRRRSS